MIDVNHFRKYIIDPTLQFMDLYSKAASNLLLGTAVQESRLTYLRQLFDGPALGVYQIEPSTLSDIYTSYLSYKPELFDKLNYFRGHQSNRDALVTNLAYATAVARVHYFRRPEILPDAGDIPGLARYWKIHFNTPKGKGTEREFIDNYKKYILEQKNHEI